MKKEEETRMVAVRLPREHVEQLDRLAKKLRRENNEVTRSSLMREAVERLLRRAS